MAFNFSRGDRGFGDIKFEDDADTGIDFEADTVKIETGGAERLVVANTNITSSVAFCTQDNLIVDGRIGIGTSNPSVKLEIGGNMSVGEYIYHRNDTDTYIRFQDNDVRIATAGGERLTVDSNGKVGIGTDAPEEKLHIAGNVKFSAGTTDSFPTMFFDKADGTDLATIGINDSQNILIENKTMNKHIVFKCNDQGVVREGLRLDGAVPEVVVNQQHGINGDNSLIDFRVESENNTHMFFVDGSADKIGIGTDQPSSQLHIKNTGDAVITLEADSDNVDENDNAYIEFKQDAANTRGVVGTCGSSNTGPDGTSFTGAIANSLLIGTHYATFNNNHYATPMQIACEGEVQITISDGDVGIGTNVPTAKLDVNSNTIRLRTNRTIANNNDSGDKGEICWDTNYLYICVATDTWKRVALSTW